MVETWNHSVREHKYNNSSFSMSENYFHKFLGHLILSGYNMRSWEKGYWSKKSQLQYENFVQTIPRNINFQNIKSYLHAADNQNLEWIRHCQTSDRPSRGKWYWMLLVNALNFTMFLIGVYIRWSTVTIDCDRKS